MNTLTLTISWDQSAPRPGWTYRVRGEGAHMSGELDSPTGRAMPRDTGRLTLVAALRDILGDGITVPHYEEWSYAGLGAWTCEVVLDAAPDSVTDDDIGRLLVEAAEAGDFEQVALCEIALDGVAHGPAAIAYLRRTDCRSSHPTAQRMTAAYERGEDVWVRDDKGAAREECERAILEARRERANEEKSR